MTCHHRADSCCPFAPTEQSDIAQNYGCLPTQQDIIVMRVHHGKTWACHDEPGKPCTGAIRRLRELGLPHKVVDPVLVTEQSPWNLYVSPSRTA
jgi:hypothetical protein